MVSTRQSSGHTDGASCSSWEASSSGLRAGRHSHDAGAAETSSSSQRRIGFLDLPQEILEKILGYVKYKNISQLRLVNHQFDFICSNILNSSFHKLQNQMLTRFQAIKSRMPRRESARRNHPLACESDIIETLHMRLTLLHMTLGKHIERKHCCFFPGEILDEVNKILVYIASTTKLARPYKVTDELFDLSTMAMEYFKDKIEPTLPEIVYFGSDFLDFTTCTSKYMNLDSPKGDESPSHVAVPTPVLPTPPSAVTTALRKRVLKMRTTIRRMQSTLGVTRREMRSLRTQNTDQRAQLADCNRRLDEYDKKTEEMTRKFGTLLQELNKCRTEFQYWRSKSPAVPLLCVTCGGAMQHPSSDELRGLLGVDFVPIAGPSHENCDALPGPSAVQEAPQEEPEEIVAVSNSVSEPPVTSALSVVERPRTKRKRDGGSKDSVESSKNTRGGGKGRKKSKI